MNCNADEEQRRNKEISRNIDRQIKIEKNKRENVSMTSHYPVYTSDKV